MIFRQSFLLEIVLVRGIVFEVVEGTSGVSAGRQNEVLDSLDFI